MVNFLNIGAGRRAAAPEANAFWGLKPLKMHILSINFISFTAQIYNAMHMQEKMATLASWGTTAPLLP